jgi:hypothetical protein
MVRYTGPNSYFFAGLGGFGNKLFIVRLLKGLLGSRVAMS